MIHLYNRERELDRERERESEKRGKREIGLEIYDDNAIRVSYERNTYMMIEDDNILHKWNSFTTIMIDESLKQQKY